MDWTHYITRSNYHTRWNLDNVMMMHRGCHQNWAHKHHEQFTDFMMKNLGDRYILLRKAACDTSKLDYKLIEIGLFLAKNTLKLKNLVEDF
jgi:hypothetical protein